MKSISFKQMEDNTPWMGDILFLQQYPSPHRGYYGVCRSMTSLGATVFSARQDRGGAMHAVRMDTYSFLPRGNREAIIAATEHARDLVNRAKHANLPLVRRRAFELSVSVGTITPLWIGHNDKTGELVAMSDAADKPQVCEETVYGIFEYLSGLIDPDSIEELGFWVMVNQMLPAPGQSWGLEDRLVIRIQYETL